MREHTVLEPVPFVPEIRVSTATEVMPIWRATQDWLLENGLNVPFWCVPWAGGQALARYVLDHPETVRGQSVLDFGTGSGLVAIAAARAGAASVRAVDVDPFAVAATLINADANDVVVNVDQIDVVDTLINVDVILAGDVWYEARPAARFAKWFKTLRGRVLTGDPGRAYVPDDAKELARYAVPTTPDLESATSRVTRVLEITRARNRR